jgi:lipoprotein-releasing system permease protein
MRGGALPGPLPWALARRILGGARSRLLSSTARAALLSTALGVTALGVAMALLTGYREDLTRKLVGGSAAILVYATGDDGARRDLAAELAGLPEVTGVEPVLFLEGVLAAGVRDAEVTVRAASTAAGPFAAPSGALAQAEDGTWGALVGDELARALGVVPGDTLRLTVLAFGERGPRFAFRSLRVSATFASGFSEFDRGWIAVDPGALADVRAAGSAVWEVRVRDVARSARVAEAIRERVGEEHLVLDWRELNRELFAALALQQRALFLLLGLIVLVATFNVASTLVVLVRERRRDFGVLAALGLPPAGLRATFVLAGALLGAAGTALGLVTAWAIAVLATRFEWLRFGPEMAEIYFLSFVPLRLAWIDAAAIALLALAVTLAASWLPASRAARIAPAEAIRFE